MLALVEMSKLEDPLQAAETLEIARCYKRIAIAKRQIEEL
jgi:hypothetical protein